MSKSSIHLSSNIFIKVKQHLNLVEFTYGSQIPKIRIIFEFHKLNHLVEFTYGFQTPDINHEIEKIVKQCRNCKKVATEQNKSLLYPLDWSINPVDQVNTDYFKYNDNHIVIKADSQSKLIDFEIIKQFLPSHMVCSIWYTDNCLRQ